MRAAVVLYDQYSLSRDGDDDNTGYDRQCYAAAREAGADMQSKQTCSAFQVAAFIIEPPRADANKRTVVHEMARTSSCAACGMVVNELVSTNFEGDSQ